MQGKAKSGMECKARQKQKMIYKDSQTSTIDSELSNFHNTYRSDYILLRLRQVSIFIH